ncbi:hypothetical protein [Ectopseudomonas mendocina]|uniref:Uncharacterized protein n=1 Tax=Ectopseudomonas mendocina TaxID=300 RepID=A0A2R3QTR3_ECTME|nr:hypothetical protein [Pseudomonas mendocina]AVO55110.1 hypothetical protein C7A17_20875 [Pseudomonas mendocina]
MLLYTKNAINVFTVAEIELWAILATEMRGFDDNRCSVFIKNAFKTDRCWIFVRVPGKALEHASDGAFEAFIY